MQIVKDYRDNKVLSAREKLRYSEIRREMYNITDAVLAATLKDLTESVWVIVKRLRGRYDERKNCRFERF